MNNNKEIISKLRLRSLKNNKSRTLMVAVSIILTCILLTSVITITISLKDSMEESMALQVGSRAHGGFKFLTPEEVEILKDHEVIKTYGISTVVGLVTNEETKTRQLEVRTMDEQYMKDSYVDLIGEYPESYKEIVLDTITMDMLGLEHKLDQEVSLEIESSLGKSTENFNVVGYYEGNIFSSASYILVSEAYKNEHVIKGEYPNYMGTMNLSVNVASKNRIGKDLIRIIEDTGMYEIKGGPNWAYMSETRMQVTDIISYIFFMIILMMSGYLIIYNIYIIAINKDIKHYGLLKTIGMTSKQIKKMIFGQALLIFSVSCPIGLLLGYLFGQVLVPVVLGSMNTEVILVSHNLWIFILAALLTAITLWISCRRPAKLASQVSPIEALRTADITINRKPRRRKRSKLYQMAWHNAFRVRKKAVLVILSLSLSLVILSMVFVRINEFDVNDLVSGRIGSDYLIADSGYFSINHDGDYLDETFIDQVQALDLEVHPLNMAYKTIHLEDEIKDKLVSEHQASDHISGNYLKVEKGLMNLEVYGVDGYHLDKLRRHVTDGEIPEVLQDDEIILDTHFFSESKTSGIPYKVGDVVNIDGSDFKVVAMVRGVPLYMYNQMFTDYSIQGYMTINHTSDVISLMVEGQNHEIYELMSKYPQITLKSRQDYIDEANDFIMMYKIVGYSLAALLALIGILNFVNMTSTNMVIRKREFAMMQGIGMSSSQLKSMMVLEGLYFLGFALLLTLIMTILLSLLMVGELTFSFMLPLISCTIILCGLIILISYQAYKQMSKESIIERLRYVN